MAEQYIRLLDVKIIGSVLRWFRVISLVSLQLAGGKVIGELSRSQHPCRVCRRSRYPARGIPHTCSKQTVRTTRLCLACIDHMQQSLDHSQGVIFSILL